MSVKHGLDPSAAPRRLLEEGVVGSLVAQGRWDDALARLSAARDAAPRDPDIAEAIRELRERALANALERLGSAESIPVRTGATPALGADERYLLGLIADDVAVDELIARSTLGRHRTVRGLSGLLELGAIRMVRASPAAGPETASAVRHVVVADGHPSSAAITRTMIRLVLGAVAQLETITTVAQLAGWGAKQRPDLVVTELTLLDGDALVGVRALRRTAGQAVPVLVVTSRLEHELARGRAPERSAVLARPIEKAALVEALASIGVTRKG
jgi:CheY-like chemotaxis protein